MSDPPGSSGESAVPAALEGAAPAPPAAERGIDARRALRITVVYFLAQLGLGIAVGAVVGFVYGIARGSAAPRLVEEVERAVLLPAAAASMIGGGLVAFAMARRALPGPLRGGALRPIGWCAAKPRDVASAALLGILLGAFYMLALGRAFPPGPAQEWGPVARAMAVPGWPRLAWAILAVGVAPPAEELLFRGVLWSGLVRRISAGLSAAVVTLLFLVGHVAELRGYWPAWFAIAALGLLALVVRVRSESLLPAVALHAAYNACLVAIASLA